VLKPGGRLVPDAALMEAALVSAPDVHAMHIAGWSNATHGVDLSAARAYAANHVYFGPTLLRDATFLSQPAAVLALDLGSCGYDALHAQVDFEATQPGECHGIAGWFNLRLGETWLSTSPRSPQTHWSPAFLPIDPPLPLESGDRISLTLDRAPAGDWTWRIRSPRGSRRHSTLLGTPLVPGKLEKASRNYVPTATEALSATAFVLASVDGDIDVSETSLTQVGLGSLDTVGGDIDVSSELGNGACFTVRIPVRVPGADGGERTIEHPQLRLAGIA